MLALVVAAVVVAPAAAASRLMVAGDAESPLRLRVEGAAVEIDGGTANGSAAARVAIAAGTSIDAFEPTRGGWLVTGSVPVAGGRELAIWMGTGNKATTKLTPPPGRVGAVRAFPLPLLRDGELAGMAWLEGEAADRFAVRASAWDGREWSAPVTVAPPGPGSQLALTGAVLADGSWLLAWSAFDGEDDEVMWSVRRNTRWSAPAAVAAGNDVPDITPALRPDGDGALLAWSRYDGNDYRLVMARFGGRRWQPAEWAAGAGTVQPRWEGDTLTFRDAAAGTWVAARVDAADRLRATDTAAAPMEPRPAAATMRGGEPRLLFP